MVKYTAKLIDKKEIARDTMEFQFEKPEGLEFKAGNSFDWTLPNPPETDAEGNTRSFSVTAAPYEDCISFATRMRDTAFKRSLRKMNPGDEIQLEGPWEDFKLHNDVTKPAVFLVGGIGITPFYSMIKQATHDKTAHKIFLFYANHNLEETAFLKELQDLERQNPNFTFIPIMTRVQGPEQWNGEVDHISTQMLQKYVGNLTGPIYYSAGPPDMVATMKKILADAGIDSDYIKTEEFSGY